MLFQTIAGVRAHAQQLDRHTNAASRGFPPTKRKDVMSTLETAYDEGTFGFSRRTFVKLATVAGVTAVGGMLVFPDEAAAAFTQPTNPHWETLSGSKVRFTVHSDTHFTGCDVESKFPLAFQAIYENVPDCLAHLFDGDSTNNGSAAEYDALVGAVNAHLAKPPIFCMGNHEYAAHGSEDAAVSAFKDSLARITVADAPQAPGGTHAGLEHFHGTIGGYHVIAASCGTSYQYGTEIRTEGYEGLTRTEWMVQQLEAAVQDGGTDKPIFLFTHHPMPDTVHYSPANFGAGWIGGFAGGDYPGAKDFQNYLAANFPQVVHFSGHTHIPGADPRSIQQDGFTTVQTATFGNNFWMEGGAGKDGYDEEGGTGGHPASGYDASQCLLVEVDPGNGHEVTIRRMDFREGGYIGKPWTFFAADAANGAYSHGAMEAASLPPIVDDDAAVSVPTDLIGAKSASFTIPADKVSADKSGYDDDIVIAYRVTVRRADDAEGNAIYDAKFMSDYYKAVANRPAEFTRELFAANFEPDTAYLLDAYACNPWDKQAKIGETVEFRTVSEQAVPLTALLAANFAQGSSDDGSATPHAVTAFGNPAFTTIEQFGKQVAVFDGSSAFGYDFTKDDFSKLATSTTMEVLLQFDETPSSEYVDAFSCGQTGGQWLEYYPNGELCHYFTDGSTCASASVPAGEWTHIVATYDGASMKFYKNGVLADEAAASGPIAAPSSSVYRWFVGADVNGYGDPQAFCKAKIAFANLSYGTVASEADVAQLYKASAPVELEAPAADEFPTVRVGEEYALPIASAEDANGLVLFGVPSVTGPDGALVELAKPGQEDGAYTFVPALGGDYQVSYAAGYAVASALFTVAAAEEKPGQGGDSGDGDNSGSGDGAGDSGNGSGDGSGSGSGTGNGGSNAGSGSGSGSGSNSGNGTGTGSTNKPSGNGQTSFAKTADPLPLEGIAVAAAAAAGAIVGAARMAFKPAQDEPISFDD